MSKNLEQEYKQLIKQEVPDLWDRIEVALEEKKSAAPPLIKNKKQFSKSKILRYAGLAAAVLALVIAIPAALIGTFGEEKSEAGMDMTRSAQITEEAAGQMEAEGPAGFSYRITGKIMEVIWGNDGQIQYEIHVTDTGETPLPAQNEIITVLQGETEALLEKGKHYTLMIQDQEPWLSNIHPFVLEKILE